ncbi:MAG TPA: hypothetical protein DD670_10130, partial [Planctomycetaceae bacterium]|nr:hypothetical protein [Planctomycetaceae bacterium]
MSPRIERLESRTLLSGNGFEDDVSPLLGLLIAAPTGPPTLEVGPLPLPQISYDTPGGDCLAPMDATFLLEAEGGEDGVGALGANPFEPFTYETEPNGLPILHGYLAAPAAIYIDFDGDSTTGTVYAPYDIDGNPSMFNVTEQANIVECWRQVSAFFAMFDVDVTTNKSVVTVGDPLKKPTAWMVMSPDVSNGVSSVGAFPNTSSRSYGAGSYTTTRITVIPHEIGHNFGHWHTSEYNTLGVKTKEYSGQLDPLHGPIMGIDYVGVVQKWTRWHRSRNNLNEPDPRTIQDDLTVIANKLRAYGGGDDGYRPDDFGGTAGSIANATPLYVNGVTQAIVGIIERLTDVDTFSFVSTGGRYAIAAGRDFPSGVDLKLSMYDSNSVLIASEDGDPRAVPYTMVYDQFLTLDLAPGTYYATVESHGNYGDLGQYLLRVDPLPVGWSADDIGLTGVPGYSSHEAGTFTVAGSGNISGVADAYQYLYQTLKGDGSITVRVASLTNTDVAAKAGVMIRESLDVDSPMVNLYLRPGSGVYSYYRGMTGGNVASNGSDSSSSIQSPYWLQLTRSGDTFTTQYSSDGTSWATLGTRTVTMGETVYIGIATCSVNNKRLNTATYTDVSVTGDLNPEPTLNALAAPSDLTITGKTSSSV